LEELSVQGNLKNTSIPNSSLSTNFVSFVADIATEPIVQLKSPGCYSWICVIYEVEKFILCSWLVLMIDRTSNFFLASKDHQKVHYTLLPLTDFKLLRYHPVPKMFM